MARPLVSVLTTVYNREEFIAECIESVLASSFQDYEYIVVDDCSKDRTVEIARRYAGDPRVRLHVNEKNIGQFPNRNHAAELASGRYVKYLDSDDVLYPHCLQVMVYCMEQFPHAGVGISERGRGIVPLPVCLDPLSAWRQALLGPGLLTRSPLSTIIRRDAFHACGGFRFPNAKTNDTLFLYEICAVYAAVLLPADLGFYRVHVNQINAGLTRDRAMGETARYLPEIILSGKCPLGSEEQQQAYRNVVGPFARYCLRLALRGRVARAMRLWSFAGRPLNDLSLAALRSKRPYSHCF